MDEDNLVALVGPDPKAFREEYYAPHLEYGTKAMKPRPFMRVALERFKQKVSGS